jgi:hypothetical protein
MDELVKTFAVPTAWARRRMSRMYQATGTLNARKIGRMRRGQWMMTGFSGENKDDGTTLVSVRLRKAPRMGVDALGGRATLGHALPPAGCHKAAFYKRGREIRRVKMCPYRHDDFGKVLKDLTVAARKCSAHAAAASA